MNIELATALISRGVVNTKTRILARCPVAAFGGMPMEKRLFLNVDRVVSDEGTMKFISSHRSGRKFSVPIDKIEEIDGMEPTRLGLAYDIKANGSVRGAGKKRGRKPRINTLENINGTSI
jgi:hypothetical protein